MTSACEAGGVQTSTKSSRSSREQSLRRAVQSETGQKARGRLAGRREDVRRAGDLDVGPVEPRGQVPVARDVAQPDEAASQHRFPQRPCAGFRRADTAEIASSSASRPSRAVASSITRGGLMRMTCE